MIRLLGLLFCLAVAPFAAATELQLGNAAPGSGDVVLYIDGQPAAELGYLEFAQLTRVDGALRVEARARDSAAVLAQAQFVLAPEAGVEPLLMLLGNGVDRPFRITLFQHVLTETGRYSDSAAGQALIAVHHASPFVDAAQGGADLDVEQLCQGSTPGRAGSFSFGAGYDEHDFHFGSMRGTTLSNSHANNRCTLTLISARTGTLQLTAPFAVGQTLRLMFVGDGRFEPLRLVAMAGGAIVASTGALPATPGAITRAEDVWYDLARPAQAVTIYEIAGGNDVLGFWLTHDADGQPTWFYFDGAATGLPGQRELQLYRLRTAGEPLVEVGSARLFYLDCNNAELRILSGEREFHTLRVRRSKPVDRCEVLE